MNLRNYTTEVPANKSIENIEKLLVSFGASNIMKEYSPEGNVTAISFIIPMEGMKLPFRLPAKTDKVFKWLLKNKPRSSEKLLKAQSERIAWKLQHEWVHCQLSLIELDQADKLELFLPYLYDIQKGQTYYDKIKSGGFKALLPSS